MNVSDNRVFGLVKTDQS